jgi:hypothetical protein
LDVQGAPGAFGNIGIFLSTAKKDFFKLEFFGDWAYIMVK